MKPGDLVYGKHDFNRYGVVIFFVFTFFDGSYCPAQKTIFSFSKCSEKMVLPKKLRWNMIFLVSSGKMMFLYPENVTLFSRQKLKDDLSQKSTWKYIFFKCPEKIIFSKKSHWNMIFLVVLFGNMKLLFPENMILFFRWKMKDDISQKNTWKYNIFFKCPKKMVFPKIIAREYDLYYIIWKDGIFFRKTYFFFGWKIKDDLYQEIHGNMIFSVYYV